MTKEEFKDIINICRPYIAATFILPLDFEIDEESIVKYVDYLNEPVIFAQEKETNEEPNNT